MPRQELNDGLQPAQSQLEASSQPFGYELSTATANQPAEDTSPTLDRRSSKDNVELELQIRKSLLPPSSREQFLPNNELDRIVTFDTVSTELLSVLGCEKSQHDLKKISQQICNQFKCPESSSTSRRKIFATLVCINKAACILDFIDENLYDCHLPFIFPDSHQQEIYVYRSVKNKDAARVDCFSRKGWSIMDCENFANYQWRFLAPYLEMISDGKRRRPRHYKFDDGQVLPFVEDSSKEHVGEPSMFSGGYSDVWRVRIHSAHHSHPSVSSIKSTS